MHTRISFVGQKAVYFFYQIFSKNYYNLRNAVPKYDYWHNTLGFVQDYLPPPHTHQQKFSLFVSLNYLKIVCSVSINSFYRGRAFLFLSVTFGKFIKKNSLHEKSWTCRTSYRICFPPNFHPRLSDMVSVSQTGLQI
jgi:hypothetical protein